MRLALTGASGTIGEFCLRDGLQRGWQQRLMMRHGSLPPALAGLAQPGLEVCQADLTDRDFSPLLDGCEALIHAAFAHEPGRYRGGEGDDARGFWELNLGATVALLEQARAAGVRRVVLFSSRAVFGPQQIGRLDESAPCQPDTHYGLQKLTLEGLTRLYSNQPERFAVTCLRPTGVYGTRLDANASKWASLVQSIAAGNWPQGNRQASEVHGDDVAQAVAVLLTAPVDAVAGQLFNLSDLVTSQQDLADLIAHQLGRALPSSQRRPALEPMRGPLLDCNKLLALGWRPRGHSGLVADLAALVADLRL